MFVWAEENTHTCETFASTRVCVCCPERPQSAVVLSVLRGMPLCLRACRISSCLIQFDTF